MNLRWSHLVNVIAMTLVMSAGGVPVFGGVRYGSAMSQARQAYQAQMKQQAADQKAYAEAEQQAAAAEAAEEKRKLQNQANASRLRREREARHREAAIARRKAENAAKTSGTANTQFEKNATPPKDSSTK